MTDLEMTRLCAEAMGHIFDERMIARANVLAAGFTYDPLHNDAQAMALAKRFMLKLDFFAGAAAMPECRPMEERFIAFSDESMNRAIVECVAKMRQAKNTEQKG